VYVGDVAAANVAALEHEAVGAFNVGTGCETDVNQLYAELASLAGVRTQAAYGAARPGEQRRSVISPARAGRELNWQPRMTLREGLAATFDHFKKRPTGGG
jgi:UDP-glucose 4-epimerase